MWLEFLENSYVVYPDPESLAEAEVEEIKNLLAPLGLAKRARYLKEFAKKVKNEEISCDYNRLVKLPGVGDYIASMFLLQICGEKRFAVDKNVARVMIRYFGLKPKKSKRPQDDLLIRNYVKENAPKHMFKEYNIALIDLGWEICKSRKPRCHDCPLREGCYYANSL